MGSSWKLLHLPATTVVQSGSNPDLSIYEVPWTPLVGNAWQTKVSARRLTNTAMFKRGSTQSAEFIHGIGFTIASADSADTSGSSSVSGGCMCSCIETGDIYVNGILTSSKWNVRSKRHKRGNRRTAGLSFLPARTS